MLKKDYPELRRWSKARLEKALEQIQAFLEDEQSSVSRSDFHYEQALLLELSEKDKQHING